MVSPADLRRDLGHLTSLAGAELAGIFRDLERGTFAGEALHDLVPALVQKYGLAAATVTSDWYDEMRTAARLRSKFTAIPADIRDAGTHALIGWAESQTTDPVILQTLIAGGTTRRVLNYSRQTVMGSSIADPGAHGWAREGSGGSCSFCLMLVSRGAVYSEASADFASHDHCNCTAVPAFDGESRPVKPFTPTSRQISDADRARVRDWIAANQ